MSKPGKGQKGPILDPNKCGTGSVHNFRKVHFNKPTWCGVCRDFIWGLGKQGYCCINCSFPIHGKCLQYAPHQGGKGPGTPGHVGGAAAGGKPGKGAAGHAGTHAGGQAVHGHPSAHGGVGKPGKTGGSHPIGSGVSSPGNVSLSALGMPNQEGRAPPGFEPPVTFKGWFTAYYFELNQQQLEHLRTWFRSVDGDNSGSIDSTELSRMVLPGQGPWAGKPLGAVGAGQLISLFGATRGEIDFFEFASMHCFIDRMQNAFFEADVDRGGSLDSTEIYNALAQGGVPLPPQIAHLYFTKYNQINTARQGLDFVTYMTMVGELARLKTSFDAVDVDMDGMINFDEILVLVGNEAALAQKTAKLTVNKAGAKHQAGVGGPGKHAGAGKPGKVGGKVGGSAANAKKKSKKQKKAAAGALGGVAAVGGAIGEAAGGCEGSIM